ncbi:CRE-TRY-7 protein [Caenorhabditis remanei]|uniref:CRE-TRY-7 protein n=1 Tax=Caenorhabditis remanei TaxID=31234 RepID=E3LLM3_CAERE|nr:CRE-TRY-7 protein [Caenorhabditis remanei]
MRWSSVLLALLATTQIVSCDPLDKSENERRFQDCGRKMTSKVYMGRDAQQSEAPWSVFFLRFNKEKSSATTCTGTIVSPRHVLIATHCFAELNEGQWEIERKQLDKSHCEKDDYLITDDNILERIRIESDRKEVARHPEKVTLVKACIKRSAVKTANYRNVTHQYYVDDFAIIDLYNDLPLNTIQQVCVASSKSENAAGTQLDYFGYGLNPPKGQRFGKGETGVLRHETVKVIDLPMEDYYFLAKDPNSITVACVGDSGGGAVKDVNGQKTIVGVLSQTNCADPKNRNDEAKEQYASVGYYNEDICRLTGICDDQQYDKYHKGYTKKPKPLRPTESPVVPQRPVGGVAVDPNGTPGKSPAPRNQEATEESIDPTQDAPEDQSSLKVDPNGANSGYFHTILALVSVFVML